MFTTIKVLKPKAVIEKIEPLYYFVRKYSHNVEMENFFKFYSDSGKYEERFRPLTDKDYDRFISTRASRREPALTRQITTLSYKVGKNMISLAEGMPNEETFPFKKMTLELAGGGTLTMEGKELGKALQYVPSQGLPPLLSELRKFQQDLHNPPDLPREVLIVNGGQHGIYQCIDLLMEPGDPVVSTQYAYTGFHSALRVFNPEIIGIPEDEDGLDPNTLDSVLGDRLKKGLKMPKLLYLIPNGNNPTGTVITEERRRDVYELACRYDFIILEDDPYMFLNYSGKQIPSFLSMDTCGRVIRIDSISKVVSSGLRGGWVTAPLALLNKLELHTQTEILHSCTLAQAMILHLLSDREYLHKHLKTTLETYRHRRDTLYKALQQVGDLAHCPLPNAGLFFWMKLHGIEDVYDMVLERAFGKGLMLIPGHAFSFDTTALCPYLRLTFSKINYSDMDTAGRHLVELIRDEHRRTQEERQRFATER